MFTTVAKAPDTIRISGLAKQLGWSEKRVYRCLKKDGKQCKIHCYRKQPNVVGDVYFIFVFFSFGAATLLGTDWF